MCLCYLGLAVISSHSQENASRITPARKLGLTRLAKMRRVVLFRLVLVLLIVLGARTNDPPSVAAP